MLINCAFCSKEVNRKPSEIRQYNYCNRNCFNLNKIKNQDFSGDKNPNFKNKKVNHDYFSIIDTEEKAYILGWLITDGSFNKNGKQFSLFINSKDIDVIKKIKRILRFNNILSTTKNRVGFVVTSQKMCSDILRFLNLKPGRKSEKTSIPNFKNKLLLRAFLRGVLEGDGHISSLKNDCILVNIASSSKKFRRQFCKLKSYKFTDYSNNRSVGCSGKNAYMFLTDIYDKPNIYLNRKFNRFIKWKRKVKNGTYTFKK